MEEKNVLVSVNDKIGIAASLLKTVSIAIGNMEYFGDAGQGIAVTLDLAGIKLKECRELLSSLDKE